MVLYGEGDPYQQTFSAARASVKERKENEGVPTFEEFMEKNKNADFSKKSELTKLVEKMKDEKKIKEEKAKLRELKSRLNDDFEVLDFEQDLEAGVPNARGFQESRELKQNVEEFSEVEDYVEDNLSNDFKNFFEIQSLVSSEERQES